MLSTHVRPVPLVSSAGLVLGLIAALNVSSLAQAPGTRVDLGEVTASSARQPVTSRWLEARLAEVVAQLDASCFQPALARRAGLAGELRVRASLGRNGRLSSVTVTRTRGGTLTPALAACVRNAFARTRLDQAPLTEASAEGPPEVRHPIRVSFSLGFTAPPEAHGVTPEPRRDPGPSRCGPSPVGCVGTGCPNGMLCDTNVGCRPSGCGCNAETGTWTCTADCGGGTCVRERSAPLGIDGL